MNKHATSTKTSPGLFLKSNESLTMSFPVVTLGLAVVGNNLEDEFVINVVFVKKVAFVLILAIEVFMSCCNNIYDGWMDPIFYLLFPHP